MDEDARTLWCGNLADKVTEEILYELFIQAAPLQRVCIPTDKSGRKSNYGFVTVKHQISVDYCVQLLDGTLLYDRRITVKPRNTNSNNQVNNQNQVNMNMINLNNLLLMGQMLQPFTPHQQQNFHHDNRNERDRSNDRDRYNKPYNRHDNYQQGRHNNHNKSHHYRGNRGNDRNRKRFY